MALNKATIPDKYPITTIEELLDELYGSSTFTKLHLKFSYRQIRMKTRDMDNKTIFVTKRGIISNLVITKSTLVRIKRRHFCLSLY